MADSETETKQQEMERDSLRGVISQMQGALMFATAEARPALATALRNATSRLGVVEKKLKDLEVARETEAKEAVTRAVLLAEKETRLDAHERETFAGFLKDNFFTKADFGRLENFYAKSWDRLSEHGKDEMSHRIWEGVRKGEYKFEELPPAVREKEATQVYKRLTESAIGAGDSSAIPEKDRNDFIRAYEAGKRDDAEKVLERESFKKNLFRGSESKAVKSVQVESGRDAEGKAMGEQIAMGTAPAGSTQPGRSAGKAKESVLDLNLDGLKLADASSQQSSANIPRGAPAPAKAVPSLGSG